MRIFRGIFWHIFVISPLVAGLVYIIIRLFLFIFGAYAVRERLLSLGLVMGELFILVHVIGYVFNVSKVVFGPRPPSPQGFSSDSGVLEKEPSVAILVPVRHEPREVLEETFLTIRNLRYENRTVYLLDDSTLEEHRVDIRELAKEFGFELFAGPSARHGAKAGIINDCLKTLTQKYIVVFDADQNPLPEFLNDLVPLMEKDKKMAFIQTPQFYTNIETNPVARGAAFQQAVFYEYICEGKARAGAMFCCGTNMIFRREALLDVGGMDEATVTEDFSTSLRLHLKGWKSFYYEHVCVFGAAPKNLAAYFKQQFRWANGTIGVFRQVLMALVIRPLALKPVQWWEYFLSSTYYFTGIAFFFLMICPVAYLFFRIPTYFARPEIYFLAYAPYIVLSNSIFYLILRRRNYRPRDLFLGQMLNAVSFSVYLRGALNALLGIRTHFEVTPKGIGRRTPYYIFWPQLFFIFLNLSAVVWGFNRFIYEQKAAILVNAFWAGYHCFMLSGLFYFNEQEAA